MHNEIICSDVLDGLAKVKDDSVHLTFTSPPYNAHVNYLSHDDNLPFDEYVIWLKNTFGEVYRTTVSGGRCAINIDAVKNRDDSVEYRRAIYAHVYNFMTDIGWFFRDEICWYKQNIAGNKTCWGSYLSSSSPFIRRNHEYILIFSKDKLRLDGDLEKSDMTAAEFVQYTISTWHIMPDTRKLANHPAMFPEELAKRIIKLYSYRGNVVLDPFCGTGTVPYMAKLLCRNYIGIDNCKKYCDHAIERLQNLDTLFDDDDYIPRSKRLKANKKNKKIHMDLFDLNG